MTGATPVSESISSGEMGTGYVLGRYELLYPIASGGMAMVWAARLKGTRGFQKIVAVKTMLPKLVEDPQFEQMFLDEASLASQVRHPNVVEIMDLGEQDQVLFLVMEWIDGVPLNLLMKEAHRKGGIPVQIAVRIATQCCAGLHAAHELRDGSGQLVGLVHRDVSPQNILVTYDGVTKVVDFGVAKATASDAGITAAGQIKGKVAYMAPEQIKGDGIDRRIDIFALGIVLYALTTGKHPFRDENEAATMYRIVSDKPVVAPRRLIPGYPVLLDRVVMQALAKDPAKRYPTANDLQRALDQSLPVSMRASTDEDVAAFVRGLFAERREKQKDELAKALELADQRAAGRAASGLKQFLDSQRPPPPSADSVSGSGTQSVPDLTPSLGTGATLSSLASAPGVVTPANGVPVNRTPRWLVTVAAIGVAAALVGVTAVVARRAAPAAPAESAAAAAKGSPAVDAPPSSSADPAAAPASASAAEVPSAAPGAPSAPTEQPAASASAEPEAKRHHARRSYSAPESTAPKPAGQPKNAWKLDPGF